MTAQEFADDAIGHLRRVAAAARSTGPAAAPAPGVTGAAALDPRAVGHALAELCKNDNTLTQAIAVRLKNLSDKYPNKAF